MPMKLINCISLPAATKSSVPIADHAEANEELANQPMETYYTCCGKSICQGCVYSICMSGNDDKCPFCNSDRGSKTDEDEVPEMIKRAEANDAALIGMLANSYHNGLNSLQQDHTKAIELFVRAAELGCRKAHNQLGGFYDEGGNLKKAKFHYETAAVAGHEGARFNLGVMEAQSGNIERAVKHWIIAASAGHYKAMHEMRFLFKQGIVSRESINSTLAAYNNSCVKMRSEARDARIQVMMM
jgi:TPR repeat protein